MRCTGYISRFVGLMILSLNLGSCVLSDKVDDCYKRKAAIELHYVQSDSADVQLVLFDNKGVRYLDTLISAADAASTDGVLVTNLYDGDYTAVSWNKAETFDTHLSTLAESYIIARRAVGYFTPFGDVGYRRTDFNIVKGQHKTYHPEFDASVERLTITIRGLQYVRNPENLYFEFSYLNALGFDNAPLLQTRSTRVMNYVPFRPELVRQDYVLSGVFHTVYSKESPDFPICLASTTDGVIFKRNIGDLMTDDRDVTINIVFDFSPTTFTCTIGDWSQTEQRVTIDEWED